MGGVSNIRILFVLLVAAVIRLGAFLYDHQSIEFKDQIIAWPFFTTETEYGTRVMVNNIQLLFSDQVSYQYGDQVMIRGSFKDCVSPNHPGMFDYCKWLSLVGVDSQFKVMDHQLIQSSQKLWPMKRLSEFPDWLFSQFQLLFPNHYPTVYAMIFGSRYNFLDPQLKRLFMDIGLVHMLVVSGSQVTILIAVLFCLIRVFRIPIFIGMVGIFGIQCVYLSLVGVDASILRAMLMADMYLMDHYIFLRRYPFWWYLLVAALVVITFMPSQLFLAGFWYSFLISFALVMVVPRVVQGIDAPSWFLGYVVANVVAVMVAIPIQLIQQSTMNVIAIAANLWVSWIAVVVLLVGIASVLISPIFLPVSLGIGKCIDFLLDVMIGVMNRLLEVSMVIRFSQLEIMSICLGIVMMGWWLMYRRYLYVILSIQLIVFIGVQLISINQHLLVGIDVGQGDATLVISGNHVLLIDTGPVYPGFRRSLLPLINYYGINFIDAVIITHHDYDHIGGLDNLLEVVDIGTVFSPSYLPLSNHHLVDSQVQFSFGKGFCRITSPQLFMIPKTTNNQSLIVDCDVNDTSFLITGDSDQSVELLAIRSGVITPVDALKLAHHGSRSSNSMALLNATNPNFVWNSAGKDNRFGHPHQLVVDRILARNIEMKSTHLHGSIVIKL